MSRRGFSIIEMLVVMAIVGVLARIALPTYHRLRRQAIAAQVVGDFKVVQNAVITYFTDHGTFPPEYGPGQIPTQLAGYLPTNFSFARPGSRYQIDYENWSLPNGLPSFPSTRILLGVSVVTDDTILADKVLGILGSQNAWFTQGSSYTFVLMQVGGTF